MLAFALGGNGDRHWFIASKGSDRSAMLLFAPVKNGDRHRLMLAFAPVKNGDRHWFNASKGLIGEQCCYLLPG